MKKNVFMGILSILLFLSIFGQSVSMAGLPASMEAGYTSLTSTASGTVLFWGWDDGYIADYDPSNLTDQEKENFIKIGIQSMSDEFNKCKSLDEAVYFSTTLALFYHEKKNVKKSLYWILKGAENGSSSCMCILSDAYKNGEGVVEDLEESIKWKFLASASGDENSKKWIKEESPKWMNYKQTASILMEGKKRAKIWMEKNQIRKD